MTRSLPVRELSTTLCKAYVRLDRIMPELIAYDARLQGRDATHRTRNLDTHLTHGCIQLFRRFSSGGSDGASTLALENAAIPPILETAYRRRRREQQ
jgi:hypothetical protein